MGWASGSRLMDVIIKQLLENVGDPDKRFYMYIDFINELSNMDCDTLHECLNIDPEYDRAYKHFFIETWGEEEWNECMENE